MERCFINYSLALEIIRALYVRGQEQIFVNRNSHKVLECLPHIKWGGMGKGLVMSVILQELLSIQLSQLFGSLICRTTLVVGHPPKVREGWKQIAGRRNMRMESTTHISLNSISHALTM